MKLSLKADKIRQKKKELRKEERERKKRKNERVGITHDHFLGDLK